MISLVSLEIRSFSLSIFCSTHRDKSLKYLEASTTNRLYSVTLKVCNLYAVYISVNDNSADGLQLANRRGSSNCIKSKLNMWDPFVVFSSSSPNHFVAKKTVEDLWFRINPKSLTPFVIN